MRSPADIYLAEKEAQEAAAEEAARKEVAEAKLTKKAGLTGKLPATVEETQKLVDAKQAHIANDQKTLERYTAELPNEPVEHRERMQAEIERISSDLPRERLELKMLQDHLAELNQAKPNEPPSPPVAPPPS
ncbi:MAG: hypothetical protein ACRD51_05405 [Candidatus Acidiferrum sp.]